MFLSQICTFGQLGQQGAAVTFGQKVRIWLENAVDRAWNNESLNLGSQRIYLKAFHKWAVNTEMVLDTIFLTQLCRASKYILFKAITNPCPQDGGQVSIEVRCEILSLTKAKPLFVCSLALSVGILPWARIAATRFVFRRRRNLLR